MLLVPVGYSAGIVVAILPSAGGRFPHAECSEEGDDTSYEYDTVFGVVAHDVFLNV